MTRFVLLLAVLAVALALGALWQRGRGRLRPARSSSRAPAAAVSAAELGVALGERATLLQFSSAFCAPCRATRQVLADVAGRVPGVVHVEVDAESHLDLVRRLGVLRTPTTLVLDAAGRELRRAAGPPQRAAVLATLAEVAGGAGPDRSVAPR